MVQPDISNKVDEGTYVKHEPVRNCVEWERKAGIDDLIIGPRDNVCLACGELKSAVVYAPTYIHAKRPVDSIKDYAILGLDGRVGGL
jgi:hypothetical protein